MSTFIRNGIGDMRSKIALTRIGDACLTRRIFDRHVITVALLPHNAITLRTIIAND
jgi:hypothetical protein